MNWLARVRKAVELHKAANDQYTTDLAYADAAEVTLQLYLNAQAVSQAMAQGMQRQAHVRVTSIVNKCLTSIFDEPYTFDIQFDRKRGRTEARMVFERDGAELDPTTGAGGGVLDVASFALRVAACVLGQPPKRKLLILDEPFRFFKWRVP
jgi:hypothetical protein